MSDTSQGEGWWLASDGKWYPPEQSTTPPPLQQTPGGSVTAPPAPAAPPNQPPPASSSDNDGKPPIWKRRWFLITAAVIAVIVVISAIASDPEDDTDASAGGESPTADDSTDEDGEGVTDSTDSGGDATLIGGTRDAPFAYGAAAAVQFDSFGDADGSIWNATIGAPVDITAAVLAENQFNDAPADGVVFAGFTVELTLIEADKEPLSPGFNISWEILGGASSAVHDEGGFDGCGVTPDDFDDYSEVFAGGTLTGVVCVPIPTEDLTDPATQVAIHHSSDSRTIFAP